MKLALRNSNGFLPIEDRLDKIFEEFFTPTLYKTDLNIVPAIETSEDEKNYYIKALIPGIEKEQVDIQVQEDLVSISGEFKKEEEQNDKNIHRSEFRYGKFSRLIELPEKIDNQKSTAEYKDGILKLTLPKLDDEKGKVVRLKI